MEAIFAILSLGFGIIGYMFGKDYAINFSIKRLTKYLMYMGFSREEAIKTAKEILNANNED